MMAMNQAKGFLPSEAVLRDAAMPHEIFANLIEALHGQICNLAHSPQQGRQLALHHSQAFRVKRWSQLQHHNP